jgi:hypothetical protein
MSLIHCAFSLGKFQIVEEYGPSLININEYSLNALLLLSQSAISSKDQSKALFYLSRIVAEMHTDGGLELSQPILIQVLNGFYGIQAYSKAKALLDSISTQYKDESWFKEISKKLQQPTKLETSNTAQDSSAAGNLSSISSLSTKATSEVLIVGNTQATVVIITKLKKALQDMGATFSPNMQIVEQDGEVSVNALQSSESFEALMEVPIKCMPLVKDYKYQLDNAGKLIVTANKRMNNPGAKHIMQLLVQMYNACDKLTSWKESYPLYAIRQSEKILTSLVQIRKGPTFDVGHSPQNDKKLIDSFIGSRIFSFDEATLRASGVKVKAPSMSTFIPLIDLANHNMQAPGFDTDRKRQSLKLHAQPGPAQREIFVRYNLDDPLVTLITYGFVDTAASWVYSVPLHLYTSQGKTIMVSNHLRAIAESDLPDTLANLRHYVPSHLSRNGNIIKVSKLIIPGQSHQHALAEILGYILTKTDIENFYTHPKLLAQEVAILEKQIVEVNNRYWHDLSNLVKQTINDEPSFSTMAGQQLTLLCEFYLTHLQMYTSQKALTLSL